VGSTSGGSDLRAQQRPLNLGEFLEQTLCLLEVLVPRSELLQTVERDTEGAGLGGQLIGQAEAVVGGHADQASAQDNTRRTQPPHGSLAQPTQDAERARGSRKGRQSRFRCSYDQLLCVLLAQIEPVVIQDIVSGSSSRGCSCSSGSSPGELS